MTCPPGLIADASFGASIRGPLGCPRLRQDGGGDGEYGSTVFHRRAGLGTKCPMPDMGDARLPEDLPPEETTDYLVGLSRRLGEESRALMRRIDEALEQRGRRVDDPERVDNTDAEAVVDRRTPTDAPPPGSRPFRRP